MILRPATSTLSLFSSLFFFFFNDTATTEIYTLSLHDALPIYSSRPHERDRRTPRRARARGRGDPVRVRHPRHAQRGGLRRARRLARARARRGVRSEEHTSELQSLTNLVCRLLLDKTKSNQQIV